MLRLMRKTTLVIPGSAPRDQQLELLGTTTEQIGAYFSKILSLSSYAGHSMETKRPSKGVQKVCKGKGVNKKQVTETAHSWEGPFKRGPQPVFPGVTQLGHQTIIQYYPRAFQAEHDKLFKALQEEVPWLQQEIQVMGKHVLQPRLVAYMADNERLSYTYSKTQQKALPWTATVSFIKAEVERLTGASFNSCLLNLYQNGRHSLAWHSDNEKIYGPTPTIASVSFGAARDFNLRRNSDHSVKLSASLGSGDVLIMSGNCQRDWQHSVPKRARIEEARVSLTFRRVLNLEGGGRWCSI